MIRSAILILALVMAIGCGQTEIEGVAGLPDPEQNRLAQPFEVATIGEYAITAVEEYRTEALVISTRRYRWDKESTFSPVDFLLAWGPVAEGENPNVIRWSQSWRWGRYRFDYADTSLTERSIDRHTSNTHIIPDPSDPELRRSLLQVRRGDVVTLEGYLVNVATASGWRMNSSTSRTDTGGGACEVFFVTSALIE